MESQTVAFLQITQVGVSDLRNAWDLVLFASDHLPWAVPVPTGSPLKFGT